MAGYGLEVVDVEFVGGGKHRVLRVSIEKDAAANRKLNKAKSFGRIDAAVAAVEAVAACKLQTENELDIAAIFVA